MEDMRDKMDARSAMFTCFRPWSRWLGSGSCDGGHLEAVVMCWLLPRWWLLSVLQLSLGTDYWATWGNVGQRGAAWGSVEACKGRRNQPAPSRHLSEVMVQ